MYTQLGVLTKGTIIEVNVSALGMKAPRSKYIVTFFFICGLIPEMCLKIISALLGEPHILNGL